VVEYTPPKSEARDSNNQTLPGAKDSLTFLASSNTPLPPPKEKKGEKSQRTIAKQL